MVARFDLTTDPAVRADLLDARRATAYFARKLNELDDAELDEPTLLPGWSRRHLVAHVGYNARGLCRLVTWAQTGEETPMYASAEQRDREIERGATLLPHALRHLFDHAAVSLNVEWRDTDDAGWAAIVRTAQGREVPLAETPWLRTRELWIHAVDLDNGARWSDIPDPVARRILADIAGAWRKRGERPGILLADASGRGIARAGAEGAGEDPGEDRIEVRGAVPALLAWASGRAGASQRARLAAVRLPSGDAVPVPDPPRWI